MNIMTKQSVMKKNHVIKSKVYVTVHLNVVHRFQRDLWCLPITWSSMLGFINNVAQIIIMTRGCDANENHVASSKFKVIDHT